MTPLTKLRAYCVHCVGGQFKEIETCDADCSFHPYRMGKGRPSVKVFRKFCLQCMGGHSEFVTDCETTDCLCWEYRMGKNPARRGQGGSAEAMQRARQSKKERQESTICPAA